MDKEISNSDLYQLLLTLGKKLDGVSSDIVVYKKELDKTNDRVKKLEDSDSIIIKTIETFTTKLKKWDGQKRLKNLLIYNVIEPQDETYEILEKSVFELINVKLGVDLIKRDIDFLRRIGRKSDRVRPILIKFTNLWKKNDVLRSCKDLKGTNISISCDYSPEVRTTRKELLPYLHKAKQSNFKAFLKYDKLIIGSKAYTLSELKKHEAEITLDSDQKIPISKKTIAEETPVLDNSTSSNYSQTSPSNKKKNAGSIKSWLEPGNKRKRKKIKK
jgi:hypothetical protein